MKLKNISIVILLLLCSCVGTSSQGLFGTGVSIAFDPRSVGTQIDDSIMQKNIAARILIRNKNHFFDVKTKVLDGRIFITGKVENPEEKLQLTKLAWETEGVRSVKNDLKIKGEFSFKESVRQWLHKCQWAWWLQKTRYQIKKKQKGLFRGLTILYWRC